MSAISTVGILVWILACMFSIVHSFIANKKYLVCREILTAVNHVEKEKQKMKEDIIQHYKKEGVISSVSETQKNMEDEKFVSNNTKSEEILINDEATEQVENVENVENKEGAKLNINSCTENDLAVLPGVSVVAAKRAIEYRNQQNGFLSVEEFYAIADIKPHFVVQLDDLIACEDGIVSIPQTQESNNIQKDERKGRILDL